MVKKQLDMQENELEILEATLQKRKKSLDEDMQRLQTVRDRVAKQEQRIMRLKLEEEAMDIQINLLEEKLQCSRRDIII